MGDMADYYAEREDPLDDEHGFAHTSIGHVPITARRGGIRYPKKGSSVTTKKKLTPAQKVRQLEHELDGNLTLQQVLKGEEEKLRADLRRYDIPAAPPARHSMFRVEVQFAAGSPRYLYLLMRSGERWYTTGTREEQATFADWAALCEWLNSTHWHSRLDVLGVDIPGAYPTDHTDQVPF